MPDSQLISREDKANMKIAKILLKDAFSADYISRVAGEKLRYKILENHENSVVSEIDFQGLTVASTSFFDEAFAKLFEHDWSREHIFQRIKFKNIQKRDEQLLLEMLKIRGL